MRPFCQKRKGVYFHTCPFLCQTLWSTICRAPRTYLPLACHRVCRCTCVAGRNPYQSGHVSRGHRDPLSASHANGISSHFACFYSFLFLSRLVRSVIDYLPLVTRMHLRSTSGTRSQVVLFIPSPSPISLFPVVVLVLVSFPQIPRLAPSSRRSGSRGVRRYILFGITWRETNGRTANRPFIVHGS